MGEYGSLREAGRRDAQWTQSRRTDQPRCKSEQWVPEGRRIYRQRPRRSPLSSPDTGNTAPFQLELNDTIINRENAIENVAAVLKGHFDMGGTLVNVNIVDKDQILAANEDPSAYPNLIVRVTGFTAYFSALSPEFRQLVVDRIISL